MKKVLITWWNKWIWLSCSKKFLNAWHSVIVLAREANKMDSHKNLITHNLDLIDYRNMVCILDLNSAYENFDILR